MKKWINDVGGCRPLNHTCCIDLAPWAAPVKMKRHLINPKTPVLGRLTTTFQITAQRQFKVKGRFFEPVQIVVLRLENVLFL